MHAEFTICILDGKPIEDSECYATLKSVDKDMADKWTKVVTVPLGMNDT